MLLTALCLTFVVFFLTNLYPNLEKLAKTQGNFRMTDAEVTSYLEKNGYLQPMVVKYGEWLGVVPSFRHTNEDGSVQGRCISPGVSPEDAPRFCGVLQGDWGFSTVFKDDVGAIVSTRLSLTGKLMFWVLMLMVPAALIVGVLAGMKEGSKLDRTLSTFSIISTATPEYVSGVILITVFASSVTGLKWFKGTATSAAENATFENFFLPVLTIALYGMGYIARMTRASMTEVMTAQYIRTARLKGVAFSNIVMKHALRNALIPIVTLLGLSIPALIAGAAITETIFSWPGIGLYAVNAMHQSDYDPVQAVVILGALFYIGAYFVGDVLSAAIDPRVRA